MSNWEIWTDTNISPIIAKWITEFTDLKTKSSFTLNLHYADDLTIFKMAQIYGNVIILSKDRDFEELIKWYGVPPKLILIKIGNCTNQELWQKLQLQIKSSIEILLDTNKEINIVTIY